MLSLLQLDSLGKRYGLLPSEVLYRGDTLDLYVMDAALTYELFEHEKAKNKGKIPANVYTQEQLINIFNKANNDRSDN